MPESFSSTDHDLLVRMDERQRTSEESAQRHATEHRKLLTAIETKLESKAEKSDLVAIHSDIKNHESRILVLETGETREKAERDTVIKLGSGGVKLWQLVMGSILFLITVSSVLSSLIEAFK